MWKPRPARKTVGEEVFTGSITALEELHRGKGSRHYVFNGYKTSASSISRGGAGPLLGTGKCPNREKPSENEFSPASSAV